VAALAVAGAFVLVAFVTQQNQFLIVALVAGLVSALLDAGDDDFDSS
jgi:hypothetical protein